jgi:Putative auto-transporter adhesin, head GIN domain
MKKNFIVFGLIILLNVINIYSADKPAPQVISEQRDLAKFFSIKVNCKANINITQGSSQLVIIKTDNKTLTGLKTAVVNSELMISSSSLFPAQVLDIDITMEDINSLTLNSSGTITVNNAINTHDLKLIINGSGSISSNVNSEYVYNKIFGSGNILISGTTKNYEMEINGSGQITASDLTAESVKITLSSAGICKVNATKDMNISITGAGEIKYSGTPKLKVKINGSGSVEAI